MSTYECSPCNFTTRRTYQYQRHLQSTRHAQLHFLTSHESPVSQDHSPTQSISSPLIVQPPSSDNGSSNVSSPVQIDTHDQEYSEAFSDDDLSDDVGDQATSKTEPQWFPFKSKAELLMYVLMNSTTHPVSDEIVKFIIFMMGELNVTDVPTLQSLKNKKIGEFSWKDFVTKSTSKDGIPVWSMKPSQILKLNMAHPKISKSLKRNADISDIIMHPAN